MTLAQLKATHAEELRTKTAVESVLTEAEQNAQVLVAARDAARAAHDSAHSSLASAKRAYGESPSVATADALQAAEVSVRQAEARLEVADNKQDAAARSVQTAREALDAAKARAELAGHALAASPDLFHEQVSAPALRFLAGLETMREAAAEIDRAVAASHAAAVAHTAAGGGHLPTLDGAHVLLDAIDALTDRGVVVDSHAWHAIRGMCESSPMLTAAKKNRAIGHRFGGLVDLLSALIEAGPALQTKVVWAKARNARARRCRTHYEAEALDRAESATSRVSGRGA